MKTPTKAPAPELSSLVNDTMGDGKKTRPEKKPLQEIKKIDWMEFNQELRETTDYKKELEEEYRVVKLLQQSGVIPADLGQYLITNILSRIADDLHGICRLFPDTLLDHTGKEVWKLEDDLKRKWFDDEAIDKNSEMRALNTVFEAECKRIEAAVFRAYGEFDLADLMERNREAYDQLMGVGKKYFTK